MRYVNPACTVVEQNLVACQSGLDIYFYTIKPLQPGQELLVWYCPEFAQRCNYPPLGQLPIDSIGKRASSGSIHLGMCKYCVSGHLKLTGTIHVPTL